MQSDSPLGFASPSSPPAHPAAPGGAWRISFIYCHPCRWRAMEECELTGGFLADSLGLRELLELLQLSAKQVQCHNACFDSCNQSSSQQEVQHFILVDGRDGFQEGVWQILLGETRSHPVGCRRALGEWHFWTFKYNRGRDWTSVCLHRPLSRGSHHHIHPLSVLEKFLMLNFQDEEEGMRLDAAPCQEELARPLCQYQHSSPHH